VDRVGLLPVKAAQRDYHLVVANVFLIGGEQKLLGRSGLRKEAQPYSLTVQLAYQDKATTGESASLSMRRSLWIHNTQRAKANAKLLR
ncbi:hypothetical protein Lpp126_04376, partial [Lacticaseibacillus paracasei subsp. paracasei Lpp126]